MTRSSRAIALCLALSLVTVVLLTAGCTSATKPTGQTVGTQTSEKPAARQDRHAAHRGLAAAVGRRAARLLRDRGHDRRSRSCRSSPRRSATRRSRRAPSTPTWATSSRRPTSRPAASRSRSRRSCSAPTRARAASASSQPRSRAITDSQLAGERAGRHVLGDHPGVRARRPDGRGWRRRLPASRSRRSRRFRCASSC